MPTTAELLNTPKVLEFEGKTYDLREPTLEEQGLYQVWLEQQARDAAGRDLTATEGERRAAKHQVNLDAGAGVFEWGGEQCVKALSTYKGSAKILAITLKLDDDAAMRLMKAKAWELADMLGKAVQDGDPKAVGQLLRTLGLPESFLLPSSSIPRSGRRKTSKRSKNSRTRNSGAGGARSSATSTATSSRPPASVPAG